MRGFAIVSTILKKPLYLLLTMGTAWVIFTGAVWLPNISLIVDVVGSSATGVDKARFLGSLYQSISTNFTVVSATYTILIALMFGVQTTLLTYYIRKIRTSRSSLRSIGGMGLGGLIAGFFGIGCAACGTFILTTVLSLIGAGGILTFLPFGGEEFGFLGVALLLYSNLLLVKKIDAPFVCPI